MRRMLGVAFTLLAVTLTGCQEFGGDHAVRRLIEKPVEVPKLAAASVEAAARVDEIGRALLAGTPLGIPEIAFHTVGSAEPELFHHDSHTLYVTEGLVNLCKSDEQLAAVLATEVGQMTAEFRRTARMQFPDPIPKAATSAPLDRTTDYDPGRDLYLAQLEKRQARSPADKPTWATVDPGKIAEELLRNDGKDAALLKDVSPLLRQASRNHQIASQFGGKTGRSN